MIRVSLPLAFLFSWSLADCSHSIKLKKKSCSPRSWNPLADGSFGPSAGHSRCWLHHCQHERRLFHSGHCWQCQSSSMQESPVILLLIHPAMHKQLFAWLIFFLTIPMCVCIYIYRHTLLGCKYACETKIYLVAMGVKLLGMSLFIGGGRQFVQRWQPTEGKTVSLDRLGLVSAKWWFHPTAPIFLFFWQLYPFMFLLPSTEVVIEINLARPLDQNRYTVPILLNFWT